MSATRQYRKVRIFIASPGDVATESARVCIRSSRSLIELASSPNTWA